MEDIAIEVYYISKKDCNVCKVLRPKIEALCNSKGVNFKYIDLLEQPEVSGQFMVFNVPTILILIDNREYKRYSRNISVAEFEQDLERYIELINQ